MASSYEEDVIFNKELTPISDPSFEGVGCFEKHNVTSTCERGASPPVEWGWPEDELSEGSEFIPLNGGWGTLDEPHYSEEGGQRGLDKNFGHETQFDTKQNVNLSLPLNLAPHIGPTCLSDPIQGQLTPILEGINPPSFTDENFTNKSEENDFSSDWGLNEVTGSTTSNSRSLTLISRSLSLSSTTSGKKSLGNIGRSLSSESGSNRVTGTLNLKPRSLASRSFSFNSASSRSDSGSNGVTGTMNPNPRSSTFASRSFSFNSASSRSLADFDRSLSISLEELMENIKVPQTGQEEVNFFEEGEENGGFDPKNLKYDEEKAINAEDEHFKYVAAALNQTKSQYIEDKNHFEIKTNAADVSAIEECNLEVTESANDEVTAKVEDISLVEDPEDNILSKSALGGQSSVTDYQNGEIGLNNHLDHTVEHRNHDIHCNNDLEDTLCREECEYEVGLSIEPDVVNNFINDTLVGEGDGGDMSINTLEGAKCENMGHGLNNITDVCAAFGCYDSMTYGATPSEGTDCGAMVASSQDCGTTENNPITNNGKSNIDEGTMSEGTMSGAMGPSSQACGTSENSPLTSDGESIIDEGTMSEVTTRGAVDDFRQSIPTNNNSNVMDGVDNSELQNSLTEGAECGSPDESRLIRGSNRNNILLDNSSSNTSQDIIVEGTEGAPSYHCGTVSEKPLTLDLSQSHEEKQENTGSCQTPEYCRELSSLTLGVATNSDLDSSSQGQMQGKTEENGELPSATNFVKLSRPRRAKEIPEEILYSGVVTFPGCYDISRRPVLFVHSSATEWQRLGKLEITRLMLYLISSASYITLLVHVEKEEAWNLVKEAILLFQWNRPGIISRIIVIVGNSDLHPDVHLFKAQCTIVHELSDLHEFIDVNNLPQEFGGNKMYDHEEWIKQRLELESYVLLCEMLQHNFARNTVSMTTAAMPTTLQGTADMLNRHRSTMTELLDDMKVRDLHDTGHRFLTQLNRDDKPENQLYADQIHSSYESVCSAIQRYVQVADERLLALERHLLVKQFEESCDRILSWASDRRNELNRKFGEVADSLNELRKQRQEFDRFYLEVVKQYAQCDCLLTEANQLSSSGFLGKVNSHAQNAAEQISLVVQDMEMKKEEVETASQLYLFVDQAYSWALTGMKFVASLNMSDTLSIEEYQEQINKYDEYMSTHPPILNEEFTRMREIAAQYNNVKCQRQCEIAQQKCNETKELFKKRRRLLVKARDHQIAELKKKSSDSSSQPSTEENTSEHTSETDSVQAEINSDTFQEKPRGLLRQNSDISHRNRTHGGSNNNNNGGIPTLDGPSESASTGVSGAVPAKHRPKKMLRKSASMSSHHSSTTQRLKIGSPLRNHEPDTQGRTKWSLAIEELIVTEIEYVKSLDYIIEHYYPIMNQLDDVPQPLRGKRGVIFGNIENIRDFHACQFVEALQGCSENPAKVAEVFIQHRDSFSMYALYSKNKPRSDELMREHGTKFFRTKQQQLRDKMDLASYLLKPVQRMGKYALLLHNIGKHSDVRHRSSLREAESLVKFQLRHGNDLLAMDSIINCDVNLKEQGELKRQDEFLIFHGRRKYVRHIFLFDDLILLSKPQRVHGGHDLYHHKSSHKTSEIGLTENIGDTGLKFEIWFRRPMQDNIILHASCEEKKKAWVEDIRSILWKQALRNKENRRVEMVSMGVGSKPHLDIRSSQSPITDRSVAAERLMGGRVLPSRSRASIAVATFDHSCKRPHSTVSTSSTSSNGSFQLIPPQPASMFDFRAIVEGDEYDSGSGRGSSLCTSNGEMDPLEGADLSNEAHPQQYVTTV